MGEQVEQYEATNGLEGGTLNGKPVIVLTCKGGKSGKLRKMPLDEVEHNGTYGIGPMMGQANVFYRFFPEKLPSAIQRYHNE